MYHPLEIGVRFEDLTISGGYLNNGHRGTSVPPARKQYQFRCFHTNTEIKTVCMELRTPIRFSNKILILQNRQEV
jgi:hypothetical protein